MMEKPPTRRWFQFRLRTLLLAILALSLPLSWFAVRMERARGQQAAVEAIKGVGGHAGYEWQFTTEPEATWLRGLLGDDFFYPIKSVDLPSNITDHELEHVRVLKHLECLLLSDTQITDDGLKHLEGLTNLEYLDLEGTQITDAGLEHLEGLTNLESLDLDYTQITDAGLEHLEGLTNLESLDLEGTQITDAGLEHLEELTNLLRLTLNSTQITDAGLGHLEGLNVFVLFVNDTQVTAQGAEIFQTVAPNCMYIHHD